MTNEMVDTQIKSDVKFDDNSRPKSNLTSTSRHVPALVEGSTGIVGAPDIKGDGSTGACEMPMDINMITASNGKTVHFLLYSYMVTPPLSFSLH